MSQITDPKETLIGKQFSSYWWEQNSFLQWWEQNLSETLNCIPILLLTVSMSLAPKDSLKQSEFCWDLCLKCKIMKSLLGLLHPSNLKLSETWVVCLQDGGGNLVLLTKRMVPLVCDPHFQSTKQQLLCLKKKMALGWKDTSTQDHLGSERFDSMHHEFLATKQHGWIILPVNIVSLWATLVVS